MDDRLWLALTVGLGVLLAANLALFCLLLMKLRGGRGQVSSEEELLQMVDAGEETGVIRQEEREMIENIFELNDTTAGDVMVHRTDMELLHIDDSREEILRTIEESGLSRFPVYGEDPDDIVGILNVRDYLLNTQREQPRELRVLLREPYFVPETVRTDILFRDMQARKVHLAIVVDEYGGTAGLVTLEDLLEEIVGNIYDEFDPAETAEIIPLGDFRWRIAGGADLEEVAEALDVSIPESEEYDTLGGLVFSRLDLLPEDGEQVDVTACGLRIHVESIVDHRVEWCLVERDPGGEEEDGE